MKIKNNTILAIDPGTLNCGYCFMTEGMSLVEYGLIKTKEITWLKNCENVWFRLQELYFERWPKHIIIEYPELHAGMMALAARESGAIFKLSFLCGGMYSMFNETSSIEIVKPSTWKGQLPKEVVRKRLYKIYPEIKNKDLDHNIVDAIGIGYYTIKNRSINQ